MKRAAGDESRKAEVPPTITVVEQEPVPCRVCEVRRSLGLPPEDHSIGFKPREGKS